MVLSSWGWTYLFFTCLLLLHQFQLLICAFIFIYLFFSELFFPKIIPSFFFFFHNEEFIGVILNLHTIWNEMIWNCLQRVIWLLLWPAMRPTYWLFTALLQTKISLRKLPPLHIPNTNSKWSFGPKQSVWYSPKKMEINKMLSIYFMLNAKILGCSNEDNRMYIGQWIQGVVGPNDCNKKRRCRVGCFNWRISKTGADRGRY